MSSLQEEEQRLVRLLDEQHDWPCLFVFKFIVPRERAKELELLFNEAQKTEVRPSAQGRYQGYTFHCAVASGHEVLALYARAKGIPGIISL